MGGWEAGMGNQGRMQTLTNTGKQTEALGTLHPSVKSLQRHRTARHKRNRELYSRFGSTEATGFASCPASTPFIASFRFTQLKGRFLIIDNTSYTLQWSPRRPSLLISQGPRDMRRQIWTADRRNVALSSVVFNYIFVAHAFSGVNSLIMHPLS
jgi:hypothetical protein